MSFDDVPVELLSIIFESVPAAYRLAAKCTCKLWNKIMPWFDPQEALRQLIIAGDGVVLKWMIGSRELVGARVRLAAFHGHSSIVFCLCREIAGGLSYACMGAAEGGRSHLLAQLIANDRTHSYILVDLAIMSGDLDTYLVIEKFYTDWISKNLRDVAETAIHANNKLVIEHLVRTADSFSRRDTILDAAAEKAILSNNIVMWAFVSRHSFSAKNQRINEWISSQIRRANEI